jgi:hypothetical protein
VRLSDRRRVEVEEKVRLMLYFNGQEGGCGEYIEESVRGVSTEVVEV